jgi:hypothetical protein
MAALRYDDPIVAQTNPLDMAILGADSVKAAQDLVLVLALEKCAKLAKIRALQCSNIFKMPAIDRS